MTDGAGNSGTASFTWTIDATNPSVTIDSHPNDPTSLTGAAFTFTGDPGTGTAIAATTCQLDGSLFAACDSSTAQTYAGPLADGSHTFTVKVTDGAGNSGTASFTWTIDATNPSVTIDSHPNDPTSLTGAAFTFTGDPGTGTAIAATTCQLDGSLFAACDSSTAQTYAGPLADGSHTFTVKVTDGAGNSGTASFTWTIDATNPSVTIDSHPNDPTSLTGAAFTFTGDPGTGTAIAATTCQLDGSLFAACDSSTAQTYAGPLADGSHTFTVKVTDGAGNSGTASFTWTIDTLAPAAPAITSSNPASPSSSTTPSLIGSAEALSTVRIYTDASCSSVSPATGPAALFSLTGLTVTAGANTTTSFYATATDAAGNVSDCSTPAFTYTNDNIAPSVTIDSHPNDPTSLTGAAFTFTGDPGTGTAIAATTCQLDGSLFAACDSSTAQTYAGPLADGSHTFTVKVTDGAGNGTASFTWTIDTLAPAARRSRAATRPLRRRARPRRSSVPPRRSRRCGSTRTRAARASLRPPARPPCSP